MKSVRAEILFVGVILLAPFLVSAQEPLNNYSAQRLADARCLAGTGVDNGFDPIAQGAVCLETPAPDASALECKDIENPTIVSRCDAGKCVAKEMCKKPLATKPTEIPGGSGGEDDPLKPAPTPTPAPSTPTPSPTPSAPQPSTPSPSPSAPSIPSGGSGGGGTSGSVRPSPTGEGWEGELISESPKPVTPPKPGTTFTDSGSPFTLKPGTKPSIGGIISGNGEYLDGVFSGGNPFGNTFGDASPSFGGTGASVGFNLFSNFISTIGSLFGGFGGGGGLSSGNSSPTPAPAPAPAPAPTPAPTPQPQPTPVTTKPPVQVADAAAQDRLKALDEKLKRLNESRGIDINKPTQSPLDLPLERNILTGFPIVPLQPADRIGLPTVGSGEPLIGGTPRGTLPPAVVKDAENPSGITVPIPEVTPLPPSVVTTIIPTTAAEAFAVVEETREALDDRSWFGEMLDWVGIGSKEGVAYRQALNDLKAASMREGLEKIAADVRAIPSTVQVAQGGSVMTDATPPETEALENTLTPQQRAEFEREYEDLVREFDAAASDEERQNIINKKFDELRAIDPAIEKALEGTTFEIDLESEIAAAAPQPAPTPSRLLEGLSKIGERVAEAARTAIDRLGYVLGVGASIPEGVEIPVTETPPQPEPTPTPEPEPTPMPDTKPAPTPAPAPQPATGNLIGEALVSAQEAAANAWQGVKDFAAGQWEKAMAVLTPSEEALPGAGLPDSPNMTPEQELPGIEVVQTPDVPVTGLPQNVTELAEMLDSSQVAEEVRSSYVNEILGSKEQGWAPSSDQYQEAIGIVESAPDDRGMFARTMDRFINYSDRAQTLARLNSGLQEASRAEALGILSSNASGLAANGQMAALPEFSDASVQELLETTPEGARVSAASQRANDKALALQSTSANLKEIAGNAIDVRDQLRARVDQLAALEAMGVRDIPEGDVNSLLRETSDQLKTVNSNLERMLDGSDPAFEKQMYDAVQARAQVNEMFGFGTLLYKPIFGGEAGLRDLGLFISDPAAWREGVIANATAQVVTQSVDQANAWTVAGGLAGALPVSAVMGKTAGIAIAGNPLGSAFDGAAAAGRAMKGFVNDAAVSAWADDLGVAAKASASDFNPTFVNGLSGAEERFANAYARSAREAVQAEVASGTVAPEAFERAVYNRLHNSMGKTDFVSSGNGRNVMNALESEMRARGIVPDAGFTPAPRPVVVPDAGSPAPLPNNRAISVSSRPASQSPFSTRPRAAAEIPPVAAGLPASGLSTPAAAFTSLPTRFSQALSNVGDAMQGAVQSVRRVAAPVALSVGMLTNPLPPIPVAGIDVPIVSSVTPAQGAPASQATLPTTVEIDGIKGVESGAASTYNPAKPGWRTGGTKLATGARYNPKAYEAALQTDLAAKYQMGHGNYPRNGFALVEQGDKKLIVKINDNGPLVPGRIIDLNEASMRYLSNNKYGNNSGVLNDVKVTVLEGTGYTPGPIDGSATLVARVETASPPNTVSAQTPTVPPVQNVVVTPDELASRSLTANIPPRAPVGTPQLEAINPLNEVDDFFGRIFTPTEQGVKDIVNQVIKQNPYVPRTKLAAQVLKEQSSAVGTSAYKKLRDNVARELAGRRDGQGGVSAAEAARADAEIGRQLAVLNGELQPQRTIGEVAKATGRPEIPGLEGKGHFMVPLQAPETLPKRVAIIMHQTEGSYAVGHARAQMSRPNKVGTTIWVERDGTFYWAAPESANPKHIRSGSSLRGDNKYIDNSQTRGVITSENTIGIEFAGNPPGRLQNPLTAEQLDTAAKLGRFLQERYNIPSDKVYAHSWVQHKAESSARVADRYVEGAAAANVVRMLGYRPGIDSAADFTSVSDRALVNTAVANLPAGGPLDSTVRTALRDMGDGVLVAENVAVPDAPAAAITDVAFNRVSPFSAAPQSGEELVRNFTTPSALEATSPLNVRPSPVLVSEPKPIAQPSAPTQVAVNEPARTPGSAAEPRGFSPLDLIEVPIAIGNAPTWVANRIADAGSYIRTALVGPAVPENPRGSANVPSSGQVVASNEPGVPVRTPENTEILPSPTGQSLEPVAPTVVAESRPIAIARVPLTEGEVIRPTTPTSIALNPSNRLGNEIVQVAERPVQIASKTVRVEDISGADATAVASADVKGALAGVEAAEARAVAAKVFLAELDTSKKLADNVNRLMSAYFNHGKVLDPQSLSSAIQKSVAQVNRFERAIADAEALGALDAATAARVRELFEPVKSTSQLLETQRPQLMRLVPNSHGKVSLGATFGVDGAAEGLQAIKTTPARLSDSLTERQALETAARSGAEKTIAAADAARAAAKRLAEAEQLRLVEEARIAEARAAQIVNQEGPVAYVPSATPGTWTSADALAAPKGPFEVSITRVSDTPNTPQGPADLPGQEPGVPSGRTPTIAREEEIDPALNPPPLPRQDPELPFPENTGARPDGEISPTLTTGGGPITPAIADEGLISRTRNALSDAFARARFNTQVGWSRLTGSGRPAEVTAPMNDSFAQRLDAWSRSEGSRLERMQELATLREALQARQQIVARNAADLAAVTPEPQSGIPSVRDTELASMNKEMSTALTRGDESIQDLVRAEEALAKNTPEGDAEARALAASGLDKVRERAAAESRALTIARANTEVPADDMIGRLGQWEARYGGAAQAASDGGSGGTGGTAGGSGAAAADDTEPSRATRIANALCLGGRVRQFICGALGFTGVVMTYQQVTVDGAPQETQKDATNFNGIPVKDDTSVIFQIPPGGGTPVPAPTPDDSSDTTSSDAPRQPAPDPRTDTPRPDPSGGRDLGSGGPIVYGGYGPAGSSVGGFFGGGMNMLSGLFQGLMQWFTGGEEEDDQSRPQQPSQPASEPPVGAIVGNPQVIDDGDTTTLSWSTVGTDVSSSTCAIVTSDFAVFARGGQNGSINSGALSESTRFGLVCNVKGAQDKLLNETLIRVRGDDTDPPRIFTDEQIAASQASQSNPVRPTSQNSSAQQGSSDGSSNNPTPQDVRTCDPEQAMDSFIKCLCEAEPNPRGCSVPPGGTR